MRRFTREDAESVYTPRLIEELGIASVFYRIRGTVSHVVLNTSTDPGGGGVALCGLDVWLGTGAHGEYVRARRMPLCVRCTEELRTRHYDYKSLLERLDPSDPRRRGN